MLALVVNVAGNLVLVPLTGFMGAAWMTLVDRDGRLSAPASSLILRTLEMRAAHGRAGSAAQRSRRRCSTGVLEALALAGAPLAVLIAAACVTYPALLFGLRALEVDDVRVVIGPRRAQLSSRRRSASRANCLRAS